VFVRVKLICGYCRRRLQRAERLT